MDHPLFIFTFQMPNHTFLTVWNKIEPNHKLEQHESWYILMNLGLLWCDFTEAWQRDSVNWYKSLPRKSKRNRINGKLLRLLVKNICRFSTCHYLLSTSKPCSTRSEHTCWWSFVDAFIKVHCFVWPLPLRKCVFFGSYKWCSQFKS